MKRPFSFRPTLPWVLALASAAPAAARERLEPPPPGRSAQVNPEAEPQGEPETRAERWRRLRQAKRQALEPYRATWLERQILAFEKAERPTLFSWNLAGFYPRVQGIAKGSQNAIGVRLWQPNLSGSEIDLHASAFYSIKGYEFYDLQLGVIPGADYRLESASALPLRSTRGDDVFELATVPLRGHRAWGLYASARYQHYTRLPFFGLGPDSRLGDETTFLQRDALYELKGAYQLGRAVLVGGSVGFMQAGIGPGEDERFPSAGELFDEASAPGLSRQPDYRTGGAVLQLDLRDVPADPGRGGVVAAEVKRYDDPDDRHSFTRYAADARVFVPLGSPQRVLALRAYASHDEPDPEQLIPFYMQQTLGGSHTLRGFGNFRLRGASLSLIQAEYRWEPVSALELALFVESGAVALQGETLDLSRPKTSWGAGIRFKAPGAFLCRFEWARSDERNRFYFRLSPAW